MEQEEVMDEMVALFQEGASIKELAEAYRCSYTTVRSRLLDRGVAMRPPGRPRLALVGREGGADVQDPG